MENYVCKMVISISTPWFFYTSLLKHTRRKATPLNFLHEARESVCIEVCWWKCWRVVFSGKMVVLSGLLHVMEARNDKVYQFENSYQCAIDYIIIRCQDEENNSSDGDSQFSFLVGNLFQLFRCSFSRTALASSTSCPSFFSPEGTPTGDWTAALRPSWG